jgi:ParB family chromosome partitioning protein
MVKRREPASAKREPTPQELEAFVSGADGGSYNLVQTSQQLQAAPLVDIDLIDPDPEQPRKKFDEKKLEELSESIKTRSDEGKVGVKTPISIRVNPVSEGRYLINHGERRWRASRMADQSQIPAFIDEDHSEDDAVVENVQRDDLTPREIADYIGRQLAKGRKKGEIAKALGKSNAYISQHVVLLDLPDAIADGFNTGRFNDVTVVNELVKAHKKDPEGTEEWLADESQVVNRTTVDELKLNMTDGEDDLQQGTHSATIEPDQEDDQGSQPVVEQPGTKDSKQDDPDKFKKAIVIVSHDDRQARLLLDRRPSVQGQAWLKYDDDGYEFEANLNDVKITALIEG